MDKADHLPEGYRDFDPPLHHIVLAKNRTGHHADAHLILASVFQGVILQLQPDPPVKGLDLRHRIGDVHGIVPALPGIAIVPPHGIAPPGHVSPRKFGILTVTFLENLLRFGDAGIQLPGTALEGFALPSVYIDGAEVAQAAAFAHHHREVGVVEHPGFFTVFGKGQHVPAIPDLRQIDGGFISQEIRIETGAAPVSLRIGIFHHLGIKDVVLRNKFPGNAHADLQAGQVIEQFGAFDGVVGMVQLTGKVQSHRVAGFHVQHHRAGIAAQGGGVVGKIPLAGIRAADLSRG